MQKFNVDVQRPSVPLVVYAKQQDTVRKVELTLYENGVPFVPPASAVATVWYKTPAGEGNYDATISGNKIELTLIEQMLTNAGNGIACVVLHDVDKAKLGLWNMEIVIEGVPALNSAVASEWFTALDDKISQILGTGDVANKAADRAKNEADRAEQAASSINPNDYLDTATYKGSSVGIVKESDDSVKLGGKLPSELAVNMDLLWENASPTSVFAGQSISANWESYKVLLIEWRQSTSGRGLFQSNLVPEKGKAFLAVTNAASNTTVSVGRNIHFDDLGQIRITDLSTTAPEYYNNANYIPVRIYGIK